jgi:hypothetical protein
MTLSCKSHCFVDWCEEAKENLRLYNLPASRWDWSVDDRGHVNDVGITDRWDCAFVVLFEMRYPCGDGAPEWENGSHLFEWGVRIDRWHRELMGVKCPGDDVKLTWNNKDDAYMFMRELVDKIAQTHYAARKIQRAFRRAISAPEYRMCRNRLMREFEQL